MILVDHTYNKVVIQPSGRGKLIELDRDEAIGLAARLLECALRIQSVNGIFIRANRTLDGSGYTVREDEVDS